MSEQQPLVSQKERHLKWKSFDIIEKILLILCGVSIAGFTLTVFLDVTLRTIGNPWLAAQEFTIAFFVYGVFLGAAAVTRRNEHLYLSAITNSMKGKTRTFFETFNRLFVLAVSLCMVYFGYLNMLHGLGSYRMPTMIPLAAFTAAIPISGVLIALFTIESLINGFKNGFEDPQAKDGKENEEWGKHL